MTQMSIDDLVSDAEHQKTMSEAQTPFDSFGCCSLYRKCSSEMKCLISDKPYSLSCIYRKQIEAGTSFYGKNAADFVIVEYDKYSTTISTLSNEQREYYHSILLHFLHYQRGISRALLYGCAQLYALRDTGLVILDEAHDYVMSHFRNEALLEMINHSTQLVLDWKEFCTHAKAEAKKAKKPFVFKEHFIPWVKRHAPNIVSQLDTKYCLVSLPAVHYRYAEEYFHDAELLQVDVYNLQQPLQCDSAFLKII